MRICIDPGHNSFGVDTGAEGNGLREQDLTLDIAKRLKPLLEYNGFDVVMTREGDQVGGSFSGLTTELQARCDIANQANADLFVSIHINSGGGTGAEVYCVPGGKAEDSANHMIYYLIQQCGWVNRGVKNANYYVLVNTNMPAILTENGFIDNPSDAQKLANPSFRQIIARAHAKGIVDYFGKEYRDKPSPQEVPQPHAGTPIQSTQPDKTSQALDLLKQAIKLLEV